MEAGTSLLAKRISPLLLLLLAAPLSAASRADDLFQKALVTESVQRDLDGGIRNYQQVIDEAHGDRAAAGEARLRMGICLEKLGRSSDAEGLYHQLLADPSGVNSDILQQARNRLRQLELERRTLVSSSVAVRGITEFIPSRYTLLAGPSFLCATHAEPRLALSIGLRYQLTVSSRPIAWYLDTQGTFPTGKSTVSQQSQVFTSQGIDTASLSLKYQASLGLSAELLHGQQRTWLPEVGTGLALTRTLMSYTSTSATGQVSKTTVRPYLDAGIHLFPDHIVSFHFGVRYLSSPYPNSIDIPSPAHSQTFSFSSSSWLVSAMLQIQLGHREIVLVPRQ